MRTFEEVNRDIDAAIRVNDAIALSALADEMQKVGTPDAEAVAYRALGTADALKGNYPEALEYYRRALAIDEALGNRSGVASDTSNMGQVFTLIGDYPAALEHYRRALALFDELGSLTGVAGITGNMGVVLLDTGDYPAALEHFRRALALYEQLADRTSAASVIGNMGIVYLTTGDYPAALQHFQRALALNEELGSRARAADVTGNIGNVYSETGEYPSAFEYYHKALALHEELGDRAGVVGVIGNMIGAHLTLGQYDEASELLEQQATMQMDEPDLRSRHCDHRAAFAEHRDDLDTAQRYLTEALQIANEAGLRARAAELHGKLRDLAQKRNDFAGFIEHNAEFLRINEEIRGKEATQKLTMMEAQRTMDAAMRERDKERALLYGALPKSVADRMIRGEDVSGDHFDNAAVMFIDIVGFTSHTSHMPPSNVVKMLENIFSMIDGICDEHSVVKIKTIGDSYMCFRGDADARSNALSIMHVALEVMKGAFIWPDGKPLQFRVGIHIGPATAGVIGTQRLQYDVWGDTVNVASRMESTSEPGRIHISEAFAMLLPATYAGDSAERPLQVVERGTMDIKGKGMMKTYWLESPLS